MENNQQATDKTAKVHSFFNIANKGFIVELQHNLSGLTRGTILVSQMVNSKWEIKARILFDHALNVHKKFTNENYEFVRLRFKDPQSEGASITKIIQKESLGIYEYLIIPLGLNNVLDALEILNIVGSSNQFHSEENPK
ncbi:MAG: hypothetical protein J7604_15120 [Sporocytophaga sp.]|uniref:hypothetical protein n=1 Tax=Sporocytophaga sp. TaxID=2231183 RepID=UPI001B031338|nr:hypothetical protein [Sporocytophaga sp.]MBO9701538.1 hypothetical protein [Sporocytophaga sp.]